MHIVPVTAMVGMAYLVPENAASGGLNSVWLVTTPADLDMYWTVN
jgi:hypothetical protein